MIVKDTHTIDKKLFSLFQSWAS